MKSPLSVSYFETCTSIFLSWFCHEVNYVRNMLLLIKADAEKYVVAEEHVFVKEYTVTCSEFSDIFSLFALRITYHFRYISQI